MKVDHGHSDEAIVWCRRQCGNLICDGLCFTTLF